MIGVCGNTLGREPGFAFWEREGREVGERSGEEEVEGVLLAAVLGGDLSAAEDMQ